MEFKLGEKAPYLYLRALRLKWQDKTGAKETMLPVPRLAREFGAVFLDMLSPIGYKATITAK
jgi:hypothetical protein